MLRPYRKERIRDWRELETKLDYRFREKALLRQVFMHPSYLAEVVDPHLESYQRLEFLGDKVVALIASRSLYQKFWQKPEGGLTACLSMVVSNEALAKIARTLKLNNYLFLGRGEERESGRDNPNILADVFEALAGAIFLDGGWRAVEKVLEKYFLEEIPTFISQKEDEFDPKGKLQRLAQEKFQITPHYEVLVSKRKQFSKPGRHRFLIGVYLENVLIGKGEDESKHKASVKAADNTLKWTCELTKVPLALLKKRDIVKEILY